MKSTSRVNVGCRMGRHTLTLLRQRSYEASFKNIKTVWSAIFRQTPDNGDGFMRVSKLRVPMAKDAK